MRKAVCLCCAIATCIIVSYSTLYAQSANIPIDSLTKKIELYGNSKSSSMLFAHFDKTVYVTNENVWFTAYLLNFDKTKNNSSILSALLVNTDTKSIVLDEKFLMIDGIASGNLFLTDTIPPGQYSFVLYTNALINAKPINVFTQTITIKTTYESSISASLKLTDSTIQSADGVRTIQVEVMTGNNKPIKGAKIVYSLGNNVFEPIKIEKEGQYPILIPANKITPNSDVLMVSVIYDKEVTHLRLVLPITEKKFNVKFYPEGGNLVHGTPSLVGWEVRDAERKPSKVRGILYKDNQVLDTIETDIYGMGSFRLMPLMGSSYRLKLIGNSQYTTYLLPNILLKGAVISIRNAIADDSLKLKLISKYPGKYYVLIHNFRHVFFSFSTDIGALGKTVLINLKDVPKGLCTVTVLDSLKRPLIERIFFAHYDQRTPINITTDQTVYSTRKKVHLKLKLTSPDGDDLNGAVSVACVQTNLIDTKNASDIESYYYLKNELDNLPVKDNYLGQDTGDKAYLENLLLVKGWSRYKWTEMLMVSPKDTLWPKTYLTSLEGYVTRYGKPLKRSINLLAMSDSSTHVVYTDRTGNFKLERENVITPEDKKVHLLIANNFDGAYAVKVKDPFLKINASLIKEFQSPQNNYTPQNTVSDSSFRLSGLEHTINLKEVKIRGAKEDKYNLYSKVPLDPWVTQNDCGDYVCIYGILNCANHRGSPDNKPPVAGETYEKEIPGGNYIAVTYPGCPRVIKDSGSLLLALNGINYSKEFYGSDYSVYNPPAPEYVSTIFWKNLCRVNSKSDVDLNFYTSDLTGKYKIVVQGLTSSDVIYGVKYITVENKAE
jgi:hypothetical protein